MLLAWLAPWLLGSGLWLLADGRPRSPAAWAAALGGGWIVGMLLTSWLLAALAGVVSPRGCVLQLGPWVAAAGALLCALALWRRAPVATGLQGRSRLAPWSRPLVALLALLLLYHAWLVFGEASLRPLFAWDAWLVWSVKPKVWYLLDHWVPFVDTARWLADAGGGAYTDVAPFYPALLGRLQVWFASAAGCWCGPSFMVLWPSLWAAMLLAGYGQLRLLGVAALPAWVATYALGSLPLLNTHAALPGYADVWLGACFALTLLCWLHWQLRRDWRQLALALALGFSMPWIKLEGAVWLCLWLAVLGLGLVPARWRLRCVLGLLVLLAVGLAAGGFALPLPGLGLVHVSLDQVVVPEMSPFALDWHPVLPPLARVLWVLPNWHLLFYLAPLLVAWRWRAAWALPGVNLLGLCLLGGALFLLFLFTCTGAAVWAANYTSSARLLLQWAPALVFYLALLWSARTTQPSQSRSMS